MSLLKERIQTKMHYFRRENFHSENEFYTFFLYFSISRKNSPYTSTSLSVTSEFCMSVVVVCSTPTAYVSLGLEHLHF